MTHFGPTINGHQLTCFMKFAVWASFSNWNSNKQLVVLCRRVVLVTKNSPILWVWYMYGILKIDLYYYHDSYMIWISLLIFHESRFESIFSQNWWIFSWIGLPKIQWFHEKLTTYQYFATNKYIHRIICIVSLWLLRQNVRSSFDIC